MLPSIDCSFQHARAHAEGDRLIVTTGRLRRVWQWTAAGLATRELWAQDQSGSLIAAGEGTAADWQLPDGTEPQDAHCLSLDAAIADDGGFTTQHICVTAVINYPSQGLALRWTLWAYPHARGLRTQLAARLDANAGAGHAAPHQGRPPDARVERLPVPNPRAHRRFFGYYNETQQRNDTYLEILKEELAIHPLQGREWCDWASVACVEDDGRGFALVKESHKCVNQTGHASGGFVCSDTEGLSCTGWGLRPEELSATHFTAGWATWTLVWEGGDLEREHVFKTFDRQRFPIDPARDVYIQANTWGSTASSSAARRAACEPSVLQELEVCAELGIDVLQIDDGWQVPPGSSSWEPGDNGWRPHPQSYPEGWARIRERAAELGVRLGLWAAAMPVRGSELLAAYSEGGFLQYKLDFAHLRNRAEIDALMEKVRQFILATDHRVRVNWDVTENPARYGYFFAREYGCIYLENRKPERPLSVIYRPHTVLRDLWQVSKYLNLHRFQCSIQNIDQVDPTYSDAHLHSHAYAVAIALMGTPFFFLETKYYSDAAKAEIRPLLAVYKAHREAIYRGIVHPIGAKPDNAAWTGFQCHLADEGRGYLMVFRERCNPDPDASLSLDWVSEGAHLTVTNLLRGDSRAMTVGPKNELHFHIPSAPGFLFLSYAPKREF